MEEARRSVERPCCLRVSVMLGIRGEVKLVC